MSFKEEARIFVGGLSWDTTGRQLEDVFSRFGKVLESEVLRERDTGRPRGFGFVTFADRRAMEDAIAEMHGQELDGRSISVNKAEPKMGSDDRGHDYHHGGDGRYSSGGRGGYRGANQRPPPVSSSDCFRCGRPGHWARDCPSAGGGGSRSRFSSGPSRFGGGAGGGDRDGGGDRYGDRYMDDRYDGDRNRDRIDNRGSRYNGGRDRYGSDRYSPSEDRYSGGGGGDKYGGLSDRYSRNGYGKERGYDRDGPRGGGPIRYEGGGGYRERPVPYDRPGRGRRPLPFDRR